MTRNTTIVTFAIFHWEIGFLCKFTTVTIMVVSRKHDSSFLEKWSGASTAAPGASVQNSSGQARTFGGFGQGASDNSWAQQISPANRAKPFIYSLSHLYIKQPNINANTISQNRQLSINVNNII